MRISNWVWFMFSISIAGFLMHLPTAYDSIMATDSQGHVKRLDKIEILCTPVTDMTCSNALQGKIGWGILIGLGAIAVVAFVPGFSTTYILPLLLLVQIYNFFLMPDFMSSSSALMNNMPIDIVIPLNIFMNIAVVLAFTSFIRGSD
jgi:hypothetical protein